MAPTTDRLSLLPESLTTTILSLLPIKDAIRTSVLSRHFRHTWHSLPIIIINDTHSTSQLNCLNSAVQRLLNYPLDSPIDSFSLTLSLANPENLPLLHSFLRFALSRQTKSLELDFAGPARRLPATPFELPEFVYDYDGLDSLTLFACDFWVSDFVNLSWLKTASFGCVEFQNDELCGLLKGSPLLEGLSLFKCVDVSEYVVVSTTLTSLAVESCWDLTSLIVVTPNLKRFKYVGANLEHFGIVDLGVLEEAEWDLGLSPFYDDGIGDSVQDLLMKFCHARVVTVCSYVTQILATASNPWKLPGRIGAKHLIFETALHLFEYVGIACILNSCHSLEKIQFNIAPRAIFEDDNDHPCEDLDPATFWGEDFGAPSCLINTLQEVEMNGFGGLNKELRFLKFLLKSGLVLRTVRIRLKARRDGGSNLQLYKDLWRIFRSWRRNSVSQPNILVE